VSGKEFMVIERLVLFGATGDLACRFLLPALAQLRDAGKLPDGFRLVGAARRDWDDERFRRYAAQCLDQRAADVPATAREELVRSLSYRPVDFGDPNTLAAAIHASASSDEPGAEPVAAYLALPPGAYPAAVTALGAVGLPLGSRIVVEKPFGEDLDSAVALNDLLDKVPGVAGERAVFRVDHALALATVQNLLTVRLANRVLSGITPRFLSTRACRMAHNAMKLHTRAQHDRCHILEASVMLMNADRRMLSDGVLRARGTLRASGLAVVRPTESGAGFVAHATLS
jgi:glucose-6-phosphate 1-dehydrogenase